MSSFIENNFRFTRTKIAKQTFALFGSQIVFLIFSFGITALETRILGPKDYGVLAFFITITAFTMLFFRFGFFSSGGLLLAEEKDKEKERELIGALILIGILIGAGYALFIFLSSFFVDGIFRTNVNSMLRVFSPMLVMMPLQMLISEIGRGTNQIYSLSLFQVIPKGLYFVGVLSLFILYVGRIDVFLLIFVNLFSMLLGVSVLLYLFRPLFSNLKENLWKAWRKNTEYGIHLYWGQVAAHSANQLGRLFVSFFVNTTQLGFFMVAGAITAAMALLSQALAASLFKDFVREDKIPAKVLYYNVGWLLFSGAALVIFGELIVALFFTNTFLPAVPFILPLALAGFFQGMYQPYAAFLGAKGKGEWVRNAAFLMAGSTLLGNVFLVPSFGAMGAAFAVLLGSVTFFGACVWYYKKT